MSAVHSPCTSSKARHVRGPGMEGLALVLVADMLDHSQERRIRILERRACCMQEAQGRRVLP